MLETRKNTRSKLECATTCYADIECMTAVYRANGDCLFLKNFGDALIFEDPSYSYKVFEVTMELKRESLTEIAVCVSKLVDGFLPSSPPIIIDSGSVILQRHRASAQH